MIMNIDLHTDDVPRIAEALGWMIEHGKVPEFVGIMDCPEAHPWDCVCALENDILTLDRRNPNGDVAKGWMIEVGECSGIPYVPTYTEWGAVSAWVVYEDHVLVPVPKDFTVELWGYEDFETAYNADMRCGVPMADGNAIFLNRVLKNWEEE